MAQPRGGPEPQFAPLGRSASSPAHRAGVPANGNGRPAGERPLLLHSAAGIAYSEGRRDSSSRSQSTSPKSVSATPDFTHTRWT